VDSPPNFGSCHVLTDDLALLMGRVCVAALFLPHGFHKLMNFWSFAASLGAKGVPYSNAIAVLAVVAEILGPLTLIIGLWPRWTALVLAVLTLLKIATTYRSGLWGAVFLPRRNVELYRNLAILGGLLFYFVSGPGGLELGRRNE
jgi:putative oxidoreductase